MPEWSSLNIVADEDNYSTIYFIVHIELPGISRKA